MSTGLIELVHLLIFLVAYGRCAKPSCQDDFHESFSRGSFFMSKFPLPNPHSFLKVVLIMEIVPHIGGPGECLTR